MKGKKKMTRSSKSKSSTQKTKEPTVIEILKADHEEVSNLFEKIEKTTSKSVDKRRELFGQLKESLSAHARAEESILYPATQDIRELHQQTLESYEEHGLVHHLLAQLENGDFASDEWKAKCIVLKDIVEHHVEEEEGEMFPKLKKDFEKEELIRLGAEIEEFKNSQMQAEEVERPSPRPMGEPAAQASV